MFKGNFPFRLKVSAFLGVNNGEYDVLSHGEFWRKNILWRKVKKRLENSVFFDYISFY